MGFTETKISTFSCDDCGRDEKREDMFIPAIMNELTILGWSFEKENWVSCPSCADTSKNVDIK